MAARLLRIKAQMLLPRNQDDDAWEDPRAELVRRLLEYQQVREISDHLARMAEDRRSRFARAWLPGAVRRAAAGAALAVAGRVARRGGSRAARSPVNRTCTTWWRDRWMSTAPSRRSGPCSNSGPAPAGTMSSVPRRSRGKCCRHCSRSLNWPGAANCASVRPPPLLPW